jgi:hypothetical protein
MVIREVTFEVSTEHIRDLERYGKVEVKAAGTIYVLKLRKGSNDV